MSSKNSGKSTNKKMVKTGTSTPTKPPPPSRSKISRQMQEDMNSNCISKLGFLFLAPSEKAVINPYTVAIQQKKESASPKKKTKFLPNDTSDLFYDWVQENRHIKRDAIDPNQMLDYLEFHENKDDLVATLPHVIPVFAFLLGKKLGLDLTNSISFTTTETFVKKLSGATYLEKDELATKIAEDYDIFFLVESCFWKDKTKNDIGAIIDVMGFCSQHLLSKGVRVFPPLANLYFCLQKHIRDSGIDGFMPPSKLVEFNGDMNVFNKAAGKGETKLVAKTTVIGCSGDGIFFYPKSQYQQFPNHQQAKKEGQKQKYQLNATVNGFLMILLSNPNFQLQRQP